MKLNYTDMTRTYGDVAISENVLTDLEDNTKVMCIPSSKVSKTQSHLFIKLLSIIFPLTVSCFYFFKTLIRNV